MSNAAGADGSAAEWNSYLCQPPKDPKPVPDLLLVSDGNPATTREVYSHAAALLGQDPPPQGEPTTSDPNLRGLMSESKRCRTTRLQQWLKTPLKYPTYQQGLKAQQILEEGI